MSPPFTHAHQGRRWTTIAALGAICATLIWLRLALMASPWILVPLALVSLPLLRDVLMDPRSTLTLDDRALSWRAGRHEGDLPLDRIARMRFDTTWDFSVRVTAELTDGRAVELPPDCRPPHRAFEAACAARCIPTIRHHFTRRSPPGTGRG